MKKIMVLLCVLNFAGNLCSMECLGRVFGGRGSRRVDPAVVAPVVEEGPFLRPDQGYDPETFAPSEFVRAHIVDQIRKGVTGELKASWTGEYIRNPLNHVLRTHHEDTPMIFAAIGQWHNVVVAGLSVRTVERRSQASLERCLQELDAARDFYLMQAQSDLIQRSLAISFEDKLRAQKIMDKACRLNAHMGLFARITNEGRRSMERILESAPTGLPVIQELDEEEGHV